MNSASIEQFLHDKKKLKDITKKAFDAVDLDNSGYLERNEVEVVMKNVAVDLGVQKPSDKEIDDVIKELDKNNDGRLSVDEFQVLIEQILEMMTKAESTIQHKLGRY